MRVSVGSVVQNLTITQKLVGGFALLALLTAILGALGYYELGQSGSALSSISEENMRQVDSLRKVSAGQDLIGLGDQGLLIYRMKGKLRQSQYDFVKEGDELSATALKDFGKIVVSPKLGEAFALLEPKWKEWLALHKAFVELSVKKDALLEAGVSHDSSEARQIEDEMLEMMLELRQKFGDVRKGINDLVNLSVSEAFELVHLAGSKNTRARSSLLVVALFASLFSVLAGQTLARSIVVQLRKAAELAASGDLSARLDVVGRDEIALLSQAFNNMAARLQMKTQEAQRISEGDLSLEIAVDGERDQLGCAFRNMSEQLSGLVGNSKEHLEAISRFISELKVGADSLGDGATRQAAAVEQIGSSIVEVSDQAQRNAENSKSASGLMAKTAAVAREGSEHIRTNVDSMNRIEDANREIVKIIKVIDDIAFQTNLLALNASVEAARAGVHGKGFSVVASEVRNLANRSAKAAQETEMLVSEASRRVSSGVMVAKKTAESFSEIVAGVDRVAQRLHEIANTSEHQSQSVQQVSIGLKAIGEVAQLTAGKSTDIAGMAAKLERDAIAMHGSLDRFKTHR